MRQLMTCHNMRWKTYWMDEIPAHSRREKIVSLFPCHWNILVIIKRGCTTVTGSALVSACGWELLIQMRNAVRHKCRFARQVIAIVESRVEHKARWRTSEIAE